MSCAYTLAAVSNNIWFMLNCYALMIDIQTASKLLIKLLLLITNIDMGIASPLALEWCIRRRSEMQLYASLLNISVINLILIQFNLMSLTTHFAASPNNDYYFYKRDLCDLRTRNLIFLIFRTAILSVELANHVSVNVTIDMDE